MNAANACRRRQLTRRRDGLAGILTWMVLLALPMCGQGAELPAAYSTPVLPEFHLTDQFNQTFDVQRLTGKWTFVFFGYTHCPDVCPNTINILSRVYHELKQNAPMSSDTQFVFVSVDPLRDNPEVMRAFLDYFNKDMIGVVGPVAELTKITAPLGISHRRMMAKLVATGDKQYLVEHGTDIVLLGPDTAVQTRFTLQQDAHDIANYYRSLRKLAEHHADTGTQVITEK